MPWTIAHAAAVLPLRRVRGLSFSALVAGSMSPDFGYYILRFDLATLAHTPVGILYACIPAGLLVLLLCHWLHVPIAHLLPQPHRAALLALTRAPWFVSWRALLAACISLALGAFTHIVWDSFTHEGYGLASVVPFLRMPVFTLMGRHVLLCNLLQHVSTALGLLALCLVYRAHLRRHAAGSDGWRAWLPLAAVAVLAILAAFPLALGDARADTDLMFWSRLIVREVIYTTSIFLVLLAASAILRRSRPRGSAQT